ncbi:MAG: UPF0179 family protein [Candidatus Izemoplasmatales bacterium]|jgi:hypothetical protein|nr:UPF0179 family protein [Candidatus Izemoplasmatales bacterium]TMS42078.1 MAG: UPF0179 family protein [Methanobacterium sp.]HOI71104.1 UPF0179 family protein [Methanobacterium sp.]
MITLIGTNLAQKGLEFVHYGGAPSCMKCRFKNTCIDTLEEGRIYQIKEVKETQHPCLIHEGGKVKVVVVEKSPILVLIDSKTAFEGSNILFKPVECDNSCIDQELRTPEGLYEGDRCKIIKNLGKSQIKCFNGTNLSLVLLEVV